MIIVRLAGGLGNQMQQYALARSLEARGREVKLDPSWFRDEENQGRVLAPRRLELERFAGLPLHYATEAELRRYGDRSFFSRLAGHFGRTKSGIFTEHEMYSPEIFDLEDGYLTGYFACEKYYADILPALRREFVFPEASSEKARAFNEAAAADIREENAQGVCTVSVHLRRGDYLDAANAALLGGICTDAYYRGAAEAARQAGAQHTGKTADTAELHFYVFSDDTEYAKTCRFGREGDRTTVPEGNTGEDAMLDMYLMSLCRVNICANSTFSFWGARLNAAPFAKIRPSVHRSDQSAPPEVMRTLWEGWTLVDRDGGIFCAPDPQI
ncbi:MAG: alpha-1,2-fucosyltransferase [Lachnospiraceae bacterium]|jgi:hypothetical protein|nr:alpha-1,2-fucosyltransferase [Lachnospiraceae bacterium]